MDSGGGKRDGESGAGKWYELARVARATGCGHDEKIRAAVKDNLPDIIAGADLANENARTVRVPVRMLEHHHFRLRRADEFQGVALQKRQASGMCSPIRPKRARARKARAVTRGRRRCSCCWSSRSTTSSTGWKCCRTSRRRAGPSAEPTGRAMGSRWRGVAPRSAPLFKEMVKRRGSAAATPNFIDEDLRYRQLARAVRPAVHAGCSSGAHDVRQHVRPRPQARQDVFLLGGAGPAPRVPLGWKPCLGAYHRGLGVQRVGVFSV